MSQQKNINTTGDRDVKGQEDRRDPTSITRKKTIILFLKGFYTITFLPLTAATSAYAYGNKRTPPKPWRFTFVSLFTSTSIWGSLFVGMGAAAFKYPDAFANFIGYLNEIPGFSAAANGISTSFAGPTTVVLGMMLIGLTACLIASIILYGYEETRRQQRQPRPPIPEHILEQQERPEEKKEVKQQKKITPRMVLQEIQALLVSRGGLNKKTLFQELHNKFDSLIRLYQKLDIHLSSKPLPLIERNESSAASSLKSELVILENQLTILKEILGTHIAPPDQKDYNPRTSNETLPHSSSFSSHVSNPIHTITTLGAVIEKYEELVATYKKNIAKHAFDQYKEDLSTKLSNPGEMLKKIAEKKEELHREDTTRIDDEVDKDTKRTDSSQPTQIPPPPYHEELMDGFKQCASEFKEIQDTLRKMLGEMGIFEIEVPEFKHNPAENNIIALMADLKTTHEKTLSNLAKLKNDPYSALCSQFQGELEKIIESYKSYVDNIQAVLKNTQALILLKVDTYINDNPKLKAYRDDLGNMLFVFVSAVNLATNGKDVLQTAPSSTEGVASAIGGAISAVPFPGTGAVGKFVSWLGKVWSDRRQQEKNKKICGWNDYLLNRDFLIATARILTLAQADNILLNKNKSMFLEKDTAEEDFTKIKDHLEESNLLLPTQLQHAQERLIQAISAPMPHKGDGSLMSYLLFTQPQQVAELKSTPSRKNQILLNSEQDYVSNPIQAVASTNPDPLQPHPSNQDDEKKGDRTSPPLTTLTGPFSPSSTPPITDFFAHHSDIPTTTSQLNNHGTPVITIPSSSSPIGTGENNSPTLPSSPSLIPIPTLSSVTKVS